MKITSAENHMNKKMIGYLEFLKSMVDINSFTLNHQGIEELGSLTSSFFENIGFSGRQINSGDSTYGKHLLMSKKGSSNNTIAFISHLDTVFTHEEEKANHFQWNEIDDRIYGPGTVDIKGGTMMIYIVLDLLKEFHRELYDFMNFTILLDCAEEVGGADFGDLCRRYLDVETTEACLVFEGCNINNNRFQKVVSRKGMATFTINVEGRSAHSGTAHKRGVNAIVQMADIIKELSSITDYKKNLTVNVGHISGGTVRNRVADKCSIELEMRASNLEYYNEAVKQIEALKDNGSISSSYDNWKCKISVKKEIVIPPWEINSRSGRLFQFWFKAAEKMELYMKEEVRGGLSDGNLLWQDYAVIDGLGPGGANSHCSEYDPDNGKEQEYLTKSSIIPVAIMNTLALIDLISNSLSGSN